MKKTLFLLSAVTLAAVTLHAAEVPVEAPLVSMKKEWNAGSMTGKNTHAMYVAGKIYADCWSYWYAESGLTPQTAVMKPLNAVDPDILDKFWSRYAPILAARVSKVRNRMVWHFPAMQRNYLTARNTKVTYGAAFGFKNPFNKETVCYIEGRLRYPEQAKSMAYVYCKSADGKITVLTDSGKPGAIYVMKTKHRNGRIEVRQYLKLQLEITLKPGDTILFASFRGDFAGKPAPKGREVSFLSIDDRWGPAFQPKISFEL